MVLRRFIILGMLSLAVGLLSSFAPRLFAAEEKFDISRVSIVTAGGTYKLSVELATNRKQRSQGLMGRREMATNAGMLFDFERTEPVTMWMKNTFISLDMLFLDNTGQIVYIAPNTQPQSLRHISPGRPVRGVLELNAGTALRLGVKTGDRILHSMFRE